MAEYARTTHQIDPLVDAHLFTGFHHFQGLVQQDFPGQCIVNDLDDPIGEREPSSGGILLHAYPTAERQLNDNASSQGVGDVFVPER